MPSAPSEPHPPRWSLTSHFAWRFALMASVVVLLFAVGSLYMLDDALRDTMRNLFDHELLEVGDLIDDAEPAQVQAALETVEDSTVDPPCAFRVRDERGKVLGQVGRPRLLALFPGPLPLDTRPSAFELLTETTFCRAEVMAARSFTIEIVLDGRDMHEALVAYARSAGLVFLVLVPLAAVLGMITARRGFASLRELVAQASAIDLPGENLARLRPEDSPEELRELTAAINDMLGRIEDGLRTMRTFTASLAHELRSPLQNLIGETEVALLAARPAEEYVTLLRSNLDDLHELSDAVDNLVAWCRSNEPQPHAAERERFDLLAEADLRLQRERRSARRAGLTLRLTGDGDAHLRADREGVLRVLRNLVGNALAWSPRGGTVDVRVAGAPECVRLVVEDTGPGIPEELRHRVFEPFVSGRPRRGERGGYGLGLTICRSVVLEHGGRLWHEPREGGGTRFVAEFPRGA